MAPTPTEEPSELVASVEPAADPAPVIAYEVNGMVVTADGTPIPSVTVTALDVVTTTNTTGAFKLTIESDAQSTTLSFNRQGYKSRSVSVALPAPTKVTVTLEPEPPRLLRDNPWF